MKFIKYEIEQGLYYDLITIYAKTNKNTPFHFTFSESHTLKEVKDKLEDIAIKIDKP
ncbi:MULTISPECIES: hypothetical protein [Staphylococcus]|uniref:hypothetical protein n=1 Tax=Staphylococcus TaxID=1279 RepID=UPI0015E5EC1F|nr:MULTISPECIES: hypothetical protein [Staphylococcus]MBB2508208.1 hypothetical protein [Staphylococcus cohnii subsp. barensis]MCE5034458.1 hypothetical protein [Staphylococcus cohnii]MCE5099043.1 hypothetical protein [Staphylococcus cohnii]WIL70631.1 hypothetical protein QMK35_05355 [Staphylococcus cohnii]